MSAETPDVAILGGGIAGLTTAWRLSDADVRDQVGSITLYQRGGRLGGKAASHRGSNGRIEEHGLHVWLGYYDNAFRLIREVYDELDRERTDPDCPIQHWNDAFHPAPLIGLEDMYDGDWNTWTAVFPPNDRLPGEPLSEVDTSTATEFVAQSVRLMQSFVRSLGGVQADLAPSVAVAAASEAGRFFRQLESLIPAFGAARMIAEDAKSSLMRTVQEDDRSRRLWYLLDLISAQVRGLIKDDILNKGFRSINHLEYREWIASHGASQETMDGALVRGLYDLAFSHRGGDPTKTEFPAGLGLFLATKTFFDYRGALFWKMNAGMGDVVVAPMYQALRQRGVDFRFFHRVDELVPSSDGTAIDRVMLGRQVDLAPGVSAYEPLQRFDGLPCWPEHLDEAQLDARDLTDARLESYWSQWPDAGETTLQRGRDFDELVLAIPVGMGAHITTQLSQHSPKWRSMINDLETVGTQAFQLWLRESESALGWERGGSTVTSFVDSYDTWSSMTHLLTFEQWDGPGPPPQTLAYFCSSMAYNEDDDPADVDQPRRAHQRARQAAVEYLEADIGHYWPNAVDEKGRFRWDLLVQGENRDGKPPIDTQFVTANVDPSDRYVQALPGSDEVRLRPGDSTFAHLHLAGDWTDSGLNAGCIEAAVLSGIGAANSILDLPHDARMSGHYLL